MGKNKSKRRNTSRNTSRKKIKLGKHSKSNVIELDLTDKSLIDFQKSKSISVATTEADIKSSKIGELYEVKPIHDNIQRICQLKLQGKISKESKMQLPKYVGKQLCECLFEKNKGLRIAELERLVKQRVDTPASSCVSILDKYNEHNGNSNSSRSTSRKTKKYTNKKTSKKYQ